MEKKSKQFLDSLTEVRAEIMQFLKKNKKLHKFLDNLQAIDWIEGSVADIYIKYLKDCEILLHYTLVGIDTSIFQLQKEHDSEFAYENMEENARVPIHQFLEFHKAYLESKVKDAKDYYGFGCLESELNKLKKYVNQYNAFLNSLLSKLTQIKELKVLTYER